MAEKNKGKAKDSNLRAWIITLLVIVFVVMCLQWLLGPILVPDEVIDIYPSQSPQVLITVTAD